MFTGDSLPLDTKVPPLPSTVVLAGRGHARSSWDPLTQAPDPKAVKTMDPRSRLLLGASWQAWNQYGTNPPHTWGVVAALPDATTAWQAWDEPLRNGWPLSPPTRHTLPPLWLLGILPNLPAAHLSMQFHLRGPCQALTGTSPPLEPAWRIALNWLLTGECPGVLLAATDGIHASAWLLHSRSHD